MVIGLNAAKAFHAAATAAAGRVGLVRFQVFIIDGKDGELLKVKHVVVTRPSSAGAAAGPLRCHPRFLIF